MRSKPYLTWTDVKKMLEACEAEAAKNKWAVAISIVDDGGHLIGFARLDGADRRQGAHFGAD
jgi:glc operon protein GlcG